ncbi:3-deoxy-7-phosphoheptulonate synthase [Lachnospiraceae bacterium WCA-9-b2]|jgi:3-deoxy-7-phosphoheptulonate synthase|uniref:Phospho-2-dehydro-3-deoxyheptonate aldolase n=1 Tax=Sporofaciens musculi TaxID=2681861 RepID=A0A7X3MJY7_9FIRM|nr:3-deoxy-7-phosphoheptulonate synthase [Sporofaciens musculi]MXP77828.1 3-deoxy-7-phosphoheptulonate synthase [Sporofaciens musculi]
MKLIQKIPQVEELCSKYCISKEEQRKRENLLFEMREILAGKCGKKIIIVGPCSADREDAVIEYVYLLSELQTRVKDTFLLIPRVYTGKPRTRGDGYKGMIHRPKPSSRNDDLVSGIIAVRELHQRIIKEAGMYAADELLYPSLCSYVSDLLVYAAVGARSVEDQEHRLAASGLEIPVGMKNPSSGDISVMLNAVSAAQQSQRILVNGWEAETEGNRYAHAILRGYINIAGENVPNYYYENLMRLHDAYYRQNLRNPSVIIDCNHSNSNKQYMEQCRIAEDVFQSCRRSKSINQLVKGVMIESYLEDGAQLVGEGVYGKSITDPCLGWKRTKSLILNLQDKIA